MQFHEVANIFPMMSDEEFTALKNDIAANGQLQPVYTWQGKIIDGRNRYRACVELGIEPAIEEWSGVGSLVSFVVSLNLKRRHLTSGQKAAVALEILPMLEGEAAERRRATQNNNTAKAVSQKFDTQVIEPARAAEQAAQIVGTNRQYVSDAKRIKEQSPAVFEQVKAGAMTLNDAKREVRETERKQQREQLKERAALTPKSNRYQIGICDFRTGNQLADNSVDFIITDPPYPQEFLPLWHDLAEFAARVLKPNGVLIAMSGQTYLPQVMSMLSEHLTYEWMLAYTTPGGQAVQVFPRKVNTFWKPVLLYSKDGRSGDWFGDVCKSSTNDNDKRFHEWGQSESGFMDLMRRFVRPDDLVVDPFMGAGTTGVCAMALGARFVGYEINGEHGAIAAARIEEAANVSSL